MRNAIVWLLLSPILVAAQEAPLRVGIAQVDITPALGKKPVYIAGYGKNRQATKVHDPLMARALLLAHGDRKLAMVSIDLVGLFHDCVERIRPRLPSVSYLLVTSTHNHEGPDTIGMWGPHLFKTGVDPEYITQVEDAIVKVVGDAEKNLREVAEARIGSARDGDLLNDSRLPIVKHDELVALRFLDADKKTIGLAVQWNCHPEALGSQNTEISADFVADTVAWLEKKHRCPVVYLTGTVGGLMAPPRLKIPGEEGEGKRIGIFERTAHYGVMVGKLADKALDGAKPVRLTPFKIQRREIHLPIDNPAYMLGFRLGVLKRNAYQWMGTIDKAGPPPNEKDKKPARLCCKTEIARLRLGDLDIAAIPGEIYPELVLSKVQDPPDPGADFPDAPIEPGIYDQLTAPHKMIIGLANDEIGYIIPKRQWDEKAPFCYGLKQSQYGEINSLGPETGPLLCAAFKRMCAEK